MTIRPSSADGGDGGRYSEGSPFPTGGGEFIPDNSDVIFDISVVRNYLRIHGDSQNAELSAYVMTAERLAASVYGVYVRRGTLYLRYDNPAQEVFFPAAPMPLADINGIAGEFDNSDDPLEVSSRPETGGGARVEILSGRGTHLLTRSRISYKPIILRGGVGFTGGLPADIIIALSSIAAGFYNRRGDSDQRGSHGRVTQKLSNIPANAGMILQEWSPPNWRIRI